MKVQIELKAEARGNVGRGASRRLRRLEDKVPAIVYGANEASIPVTVHHKDVIKAMETETFYTQVITLNLDGKKHNVLLRDLHHHPYKPKILHMDFQRITGKEKLHVHSPIHIVGEEANAAIKAGGILAQQLKDVEIVCSALNLPEFIELDVSNLKMDEVLHLSDLKLPAGVKIPALELDGEHNHPVVAIHMPRAQAAEEEETPAAEPVAAAEPAAKGSAAKE